jgi:hypothetical protein
MRLQELHSAAMPAKPLPDDHVRVPDPRRRADDDPPHFRAPTMRSTVGETRERSIALWSVHADGLFSYRRDRRDHITLPYVRPEE